MEEGKKKKLVKLPPEVLADALLKMTEHDDMAKRLVERLISEPNVIIKSFRRKISGLKRRKKFGFLIYLFWRTVGVFSENFLIS